uniref:Biotin carboxyl carrier protein of acetyl-CoA carboxylase n=1 Tax=Digenea simplex TaxID=945030 RepID=A0A1Z1MV40_DIGSM|nr:acetyl-CoA carboxylase biotin carboxyl carrier protein [Digenea simplex]ARW69564.1 acetyl-CoA carboxylase biotin carboxyl carrier protein [Digenea simplex]
MSNLKNVKNLINSINKNNISQIKIRNNETEILISRSKKKLNQQNAKFNFVRNTESNHENDKGYKDKENSSTVILKTNKINTQDVNKKVQEDITETSNKYATIISPMVGTFYRSPGPNEPPFVEINETVKAKQTVCIIEAMKLMNEIEAETEGEIVEILVKDGEIVDCGQALMKVKIQ